MRFCGQRLYSLWPRWLRRHSLAENHVLKILSNPFRTQTVSLSALSSESSTSRDANAQIRCAQSGLWGFTSTVRPAFGNLTSYLVCYGGCAKGRIKTEASHWIVDAITAAYTSQGLECPFHIRVYSTRVIASCAWLRGMSIQEICFAAGWSSQNTLSGFTSWTVSPWPPKCCRWVTIHVYATSIHMCLLPHTVITLCSPFMLLLLLSALYSVPLQLYNIYSIGVPSCFVLTAV